MKKDIHPKYYNNAKVKCACGNSFEVGATLEKIEVEICSACHPFYTGQEKIIDTAGRVEKFKKKVAKQEALKKTTPSKKKIAEKQKNNEKNDEEVVKKTKKVEKKEIKKDKKEKKTGDKDKLSKESDK